MSAVLFTAADLSDRVDTRLLRKRGCGIARKLRLPSGLRAPAADSYKRGLRSAFAFISCLSCVRGNRKGSHV